MNRIKISMFLTLISVMTLASCGNSNNNEYEETYTVIWQNDNGDILELDRNVKEGSIPTYEGETPTKEGKVGYTYTFAGWTPEISGVYENTTYTATYTPIQKKYTVVWKNYDGEILETDNNVPYGTTPIYNGATPTKENSGDVNYIFSGWTPSISEVEDNMTYTATFVALGESWTPGIHPVFLENENIIQYGFYPQTHVKNESIISQLDTLQPTLENGWYVYNGEFYTKQNAKLYNNEKYTFNDGVSIVDGKSYWFKCEPIEWEILSVENGSYTLLSSMLLDVQSYYKDYLSRTIEGETIYANNYEQSDIRTWLNNEFYNTAFALNDTFVQETTVNNASSTTDSNTNQYTCGDTIDKVYLPSYQDYLNPTYGFDSNSDNLSSTRECKTTDYARAMGAWYNEGNSSASLKYNSTYWTRSPSSEYYYTAWIINSGGYLNTYAVDGDDHCVRPCISITFE